MLPADQRASTLHDPSAKGQLPRTPRRHYISRYQMHADNLSNKSVSHHRHILRRRMASPTFDFDDAVQNCAIMPTETTCRCTARLERLQPHRSNRNQNADTPEKKRTGGQTHQERTPGLAGIGLTFKVNSKIKTVCISKNRLYQHEEPWDPPISDSRRSWHLFYGIVVSLFGM